MLPQTQAQQRLLAQALRAAQPRPDVFAQAIARNPSVQYSTVLPLGVQTTPDPAGSMLADQRTVMAMPELVRGLLEGIAAPNQVRQGKMDPMTGAMLTAGAAPAGALLARAPAGALGMNVFQGSPHRYGPEGAAKSLDHIGKGEGAQAYGWGRYDAGAREVGEQYRRQLSGDFWQTPDGDLFNPATLEHMNAKSMIMRNPDIEAAMPRLREIAAKQAGTETGDMIARDIVKLESLQKKGGLFKTTGNLYRHDIPDEDIARYLDWDAPLSEQTQAVKDIAAKYNIKTTPSGLKEARGSDIYRAISKAEQKPPFDSGTMNPGSREGSEALARAGIPGLKYYDGMSRAVDDVPFVNGKRITDKLDLVAAQMMKLWNGRESRIKAEMANAKHHGLTAAERDDVLRRLGDFAPGKVEYRANPDLTRNYVTWDQDVLDRMKLLQRNDEVFENKMTQQQMRDLLADPSGA
jgi:hypothetical protein